jgi:hypothetical protein
MGISLGEFVRESLEAMVKRPHDQDKRDQLFSDDAVFRGKAPKDSAKDHDRYLYGDKQ